MDGTVLTPSRQTAPRPPRTQAWHTDVLFNLQYYYVPQQHYHTMKVKGQTSDHLFNGTILPRWNIEETETESPTSLAVCFVAIKDYGYMTLTWDEEQPRENKRREQTRSRHNSSFDRKKKHTRRGWSVWNSAPQSESLWTYKDGPDCRSSICLSPQFYIHNWSILPTSVSSHCHLCHQIDGKTKLKGLPEKWCNILNVKLQYYKSTLGSIYLH